MEESQQSGDLEMRIVELENQLKELRAAQEAAGGGQTGTQAAAPCSYCYCGYCYCYAAAGPQAGAQMTSPPCTPCVAQAAMPCSSCDVTRSAQIAGSTIPILICRICYPCIFECICGPCNICYPGGGFGGGGGRFGGLGG